MIPESSWKFSRIVFELPCQINIHIILENFWEFPWRCEILVDEPLKTSGNSQEFPRILWRRKLFQEFSEILDIYPVPENSWKLFRMVLER